MVPTIGGKPLKFKAELPEPFRGTSCQVHRVIQIVLFLNHYYDIFEPEVLTMSSITIHNMDNKLDRSLSDEAKRRKTSKNRLVKELLARALGLPASGTYSDDYREFCGLWTAEELAEFKASQADNSRIDEEDWR
jgi:hypothetical protein